MMDCKQIMNLMSMYVDYELDERQKAEFEQHINQCTSCEEELNGILKLLEILHSTTEIELPDNFKEELHEKLIQVKEEEFSTTGKLFFIKNRYIKTISTIAAGILFAFVLKGIFYDGLFLRPKYDKSLMTAEKVNDSVIKMERDIAIDNKRKSNSFTGSQDGGEGMPEISEKQKDIKANKENEGNEEIDNKEKGLEAYSFESATSQSDTPQICLNNAFTNNVNGSTGSAESVQSRAMSGSRQITSDENTQILFTQHGKIKVIISVNDNVINKDEVRSIGLEYGATFNAFDINMMSEMETTKTVGIKFAEAINGDVGESESKDEYENKDRNEEQIEDEGKSEIIEFIITGDQYKYFLSTLEDNVELKDATVNSTYPVIRNDIKAKFNELEIKLKNIDKQIVTIESNIGSNIDDCTDNDSDTDNDGSSPTEVALLKSDREKVKEEIDKLLKEHNYTASVVINISK